MTDLDLSCACGATRGVARGLTPSDVNRLVCYCTDCRAFARHVGRADILDAHGGTHILQMSAARLAFTSGIDTLRCVRLSPTGMHRWVAGCCQTPLGNTQGPGSPFIGLIDAIVAPPASGHAYDLFGPPARVQGAEAIGERSTLDARPGVPVATIVRIATRLFGWWVRGDAKRSPLRAPDGGFRAIPTVLTPEERAAAADP